MARSCVCGKTITGNNRLCNKCLAEHGTDPEGWDEWVLYLVGEEQKEIDHQRRHITLALADEILYPISDEAEHNLARARHYPEMEMEEFAWFCK